MNGASLECLIPFMESNCHAEARETTAGSCEERQPAGLATVACFGGASMFHAVLVGETSFHQLSPTESMTASSKAYAVIHSSVIVIPTMPVIPGRTGCEAAGRCPLRPGSSGRGFFVVELCIRSNKKSELDWLESESTQTHLYLSAM